MPFCTFTYTGQQLSYPLCVPACLPLQLRVVVPALPQGAVMQEDTWRDLYGSIIIWIGECNTYRVGVTALNMFTFL